MVSVNDEHTGCIPPSILDPVLPDEMKSKILKDIDDLDYANTTNASIIDYVS